LTRPAGRRSRRWTTARSCPGSRRRWAPVTDGCFCCRRGLEWWLGLASNLPFVPSSLWLGLGPQGRPYIWPWSPLSCIVEPVARSRRTAPTLHPARVQEHESPPGAFRTRLLKAAGELYAPDLGQRRQLLKNRTRQRKAAQAARVEQQLHTTGIRRLRRAKVFTTPNPAAPPDAAQQEIVDAGSGSSSSRSTATSASRTTRLVHPFYDQLCPVCAEFNFRKRTETADLRGRVALLTGGRVKIGYQAGLKLLRAGAQLIVTTRFPRDSAVRYAPSRTSRSGATAWRSSVSTCATRRASRRSAGTWLATRPPRLHRQQRLPDRAATARLLPHMMERETASATEMPETRARPARARTRGCAATTCCPKVTRWRRTGLARGIAGADHARRSCRRCRLLPEELAAQRPPVSGRARLDQDLQQVDLREPTRGG
jgi:hypothetical protein